MFISIYCHSYMFPFCFFFLYQRLSSWPWTFQAGTYASELNSWPYVCFFHCGLNPGSLSWVICSHFLKFFKNLRQKKFWEKNLRQRIVKLLSCLDWAPIYSSATVLASQCQAICVRHHAWLILRHSHIEKTKTKNCVSEVCVCQKTNPVYNHWTTCLVFYAYICTGWAS